MKTAVNSRMPKGESPFRAIYVPDYKELKEIVDEYRKQGKKIVLTQGSWDMLHIGHIFYIEKARTYGDILVVGVDSDALIKKEKGPNRPIYPETERVPTVMFLRPVDIVTLRYAEHKPGDLVRAIRPDVLVISESTKERNPNIIDEIKEEHKDVCGEIVVLPPQAQTSTSNKIRFIIIKGLKNFKDKIDQLFEEFTQSFKFF